LKTILELDQAPEYVIGDPARLRRLADSASPQFALPSDTNDGHLLCYHALPGVAPKHVLHLLVDQPPPSSLDIGSASCLRCLRLRIGDGPFRDAPVHEGLESLIVESGGLSHGFLRQLASARLPNLEHLELWLGDADYGFDGSADDLRPLLRAGRFPELRYLGLRNSDITDDVVRVLAG